MEKIDSIYKTSSDDIFTIDFDKYCPTCVHLADTYEKVPCHSCRLITIRDEYSPEWPFFYRSREGISHEQP